MTYQPPLSSLQPQGKDTPNVNEPTMQGADENCKPVNRGSNNSAVDPRKARLSEWKNKKKMEQYENHQQTSTARQPFVSAAVQRPGFPAAPAMSGGLQQRNLNVVSRYSLAGRKDKRKKPARKSIELVITGDENMPANSSIQLKDTAKVHKPVFTLQQELELAPPPIKNLGSLFQDEDKTCFLSEMLADLQVQMPKVHLYTSQVGGGFLRRHYTCLSAPGLASRVVSLVAHF